MEAILFLAAILFFKFCNEQWVTMNYHAKSGVSSLKNLVSYDQFCDLAAILFLVAILFSMMCNLQNVNMNYHAKSGASNLKIE